MSLLINLETFNHMITPLRQAEDVSLNLKSAIAHAQAAELMTRTTHQSLENVFAYNAMSIAVQRSFRSTVEGQYTLSVGHILSDDEHCIGKRCWTLFGRILQAVNSAEAPALAFTDKDASYFEGEEDSEIIAVMDNTANQCMLVQYYLQPEHTEDGDQFAVGHAQTLQKDTRDDAMSQAGLCSLKLQNSPLWALYTVTMHMQNVVDTLDTAAFDALAAQLDRDMQWSDEDLNDGEDMGYAGMEDWLRYINSICSDTILLHGLLPYVTSFPETRNHEAVLSAQTMMIDYSHGGAIVKLLEDMMETFVRTLPAVQGVDSTVVEMYHGVAQRVKTMVRETGYTYKNVVELLEMIDTPAPASTN